jgi:hypothetical protein
MQNREEEHHDFERGGKAHMITCCQLQTIDHDQGQACLPLGQRDASHFGLTSQPKLSRGFSGTALASETCVKKSGQWLHYENETLDYLSRN